MSSDNNNIRQGQRFTNRNQGQVPSVYQDRDRRISILPINFGGDGSDGNITITSGTTTLTRDMYYHNLTITTSGILKPAGYAIHVRRLLFNEGIIQINGNPGTNGGLSSIGTGGAALATAHYGGSGAGGNGGAENNGNGVAGSSINPGNGGASGAGGAGNGSGAGGGAASVTPPTASQSGFRVPPNTITLIDKAGTEVSGGAGGGGGGGGNTIPSGGGGGGGSGAGVLMIAATVITNLGTISALGGDGGDGGSTDGGGGGAAGGGWIVLVYTTLQDIGTISVAEGTPGSGVNNGSNGQVGTILKVQL